MGSVGISVAHEGERFTVLLRSAEIEMARRFWRHCWLSGTVFLGFRESGACHHGEERSEFPPLLPE